MGHDPLELDDRRDAPPLRILGLLDAHRAIQVECSGGVSGPGDVVTEVGCLLVWAALALYRVRPVELARLT